MKAASSSICKRENFDPSQFDIIHTSERIEMGEHPARAFAQKPDASVVMAFQIACPG